MFFSLFFVDLSLPIILFYNKAKDAVSYSFLIPKGSLDRAVRGRGNNF